MAVIQPENATVEFRTQPGGGGSARSPPRLYMRMVRWWARVWGVVCEGVCGVQVGVVCGGSRGWVAVWEPWGVVHGKV